MVGEALVGAVKTDPIEHVRSSAISLLRQYPEASLHVANTLSWVAEHDAKPEIRRLTREALASIAT